MAEVVHQPKLHVFIDTNGHMYAAPDRKSPADSWVTHPSPLLVLTVAADSYDQNLHVDELRIHYAQLMHNMSEADLEEAVRLHGELQVKVAEELARRSNEHQSTENPAND